MSIKRGSSAIIWGSALAVAVAVIGCGGSGGGSSTGGSTTATATSGGTASATYSNPVALNTPAGYFSFVKSTTPSGQLSGGIWAIVGSADASPIYWPTPTGTAVPLNLPGQDLDAGTAYSSNTSGVIVGTAYSYSMNNSNTPAIWSSSAAPEATLPSPASSVCLATSVNKSGAIVGYDYKVGVSGSQIIYWASPTATTYTTFAAPNITYTAPIITDSGQIIVPASSSGAGDSMVYSGVNGTATTLNPITSGAIYTTVNGANANGLVVGGDGQPLVWSSPNYTPTRPSLPASLQGAPGAVTCVNDSGVYMGYVTVNNTNHVVVWFPGKTGLDLTTSNPTLAGYSPVSLLADDSFVALNGNSSYYIPCTAHP